MSTVFVDTSALYALFSAADAQHEQAVEILRELKRRRSSLVTTDIVMIESYVLVHARGSRHGLLSFRSAIGRSRWLQTLSTSVEQRSQAWELLDRRTDETYSFVDATSFVVMRALGLEQAFTFDVHFAQEGFQVLSTRE